MKARKRTERLRLLLVCLIGCVFLGMLVAGVRIWLYQDVDVSQEKGNPVLDRESQVENSEEDLEPRNFTFPESNVVKRKNIYDRNLNELALSFLLASVYVKPLEIRKEEGAIKKLSELLGLNEKELALSVASERGFVWLERNIDREMVAKIKELNISGLYLVQEGVRFYPKGKLASHIVGFSKGEQGLAGVESYYDNILAGNISSEAANMLAAGIPPEKYLEQDGASLVLTIDMHIQEYLEKKLAAAVSNHDARSGMAMMMHSETGEILALTNYPTFDSNLFWKYDSFERRNRVLIDPVKRGAFLHAIKMAMEMEQGNVPEYISEPVEIAKKIIEPKILKKVVSEKFQRAMNPIWKELEQGVYWPVIDKPFRFVLGKRELQKHLVAHGLSEKGFVDLPVNSLPETDPMEQPKLDLTDLNSTSTGLQALISFNRLINGGKKVVPHVLKEIWFEKQENTVSASFEQGATEEKQDSSRKFIRLIQELSANPQKNEVLFETLVEEKDDASEQGLEFSQNEDSPVQEEGKDDAQTRRCQNVVYGAIPSLNPEISVIMVVDGMLIDLSKSSNLKSTISQVLRKGLRVYHSEKRDQKPDHRMQEKELYEKWSKLRAINENRHISKKSQVREMPNVLNLSFRKALQVLQNYNVRIQAEGSGRVVAQHPKAGTMLKETSDCVLELKVDN